MKKIFIVVMVISICLIFSDSTSWAIWPFPLRPWKNDEQTKINNLEKQLQVERQMKESVQTKNNDLQKQLQVETLMKENAQKDNELAQQNAVKAKSARDLWMGISAAVSLVSLLLGIAIGSKIRRTVKIQKNADACDNNERS